MQVEKIAIKHRSVGPTFPVKPLIEKVTIGNATLYLGDCLELLHAGLLKDADAIISDPPYGIGYVHGGGHTENTPGKLNARQHTRPIIGDDKPFDPSPWLSDKKDKQPAILLFGADHYKTRLPEGGRFICWDKSCGQGAAASFCDAEFMWTNRKNPRSIVRHFWMGATRAGEYSSRAGVKKLHPSQKPVEVMIWCIEHCRIGLGKTILDPYMGSGTTGVAAIRTGRHFIGCELDREYFDIAC